MDPAPLFPAAPAPDVVRAAQREQFALKNLRASVSNACVAILGERRATQYVDRIEVLSDTLYYSVTTLAGTQTMGEEYCDIVQICERTNTFPTLFRRLVLVAFQLGGKAVLAVALGRATAGAKPQAISQLVLPVARVSERIGRWNQLHLATFYLRGRFFHVSKRLLGISYLSTSAPATTACWRDTFGAPTQRPAPTSWTS